jgi:hypothetical protein
MQPLLVREQGFVKPLNIALASLESAFHFSWRDSGKEGPARTPLLRLRISEARPLRPPRSPETPPVVGSKTLNEFANIPVSNLTSTPSKVLQFLGLTGTKDSQRNPSPKGQGPARPIVDTDVDNAFGNQGGFPTRFPRSENSLGAIPHVPQVKGTFKRADPTLAKAAAQTARAGCRFNPKRPGQLQPNTMVSIDTSGEGSPGHVAPAGSNPVPQAGSYRKQYCDNVETRTEQGSLPSDQRSLQETRPGKGGTARRDGGDLHLGGERQGWDSSNIDPEAEIAHRVSLRQVAAKPPFLLSTRGSTPPPGGLTLDLAPAGAELSSVLRYLRTGRDQADRVGRSLLPEFEPIERIPEALLVQLRPTPASLEAVLPNRTSSVQHFLYREPPEVLPALPLDGIVVFPRNHPGAQGEESRLPFGDLDGQIAMKVVDSTFDSRLFLTRLHAPQGVEALPSEGTQQRAEVPPGRLLSGVTRGAAQPEHFGFVTDHRERPDVVPVAVARIG